MKLQEEFKLFETMWDKSLTESVDPVYEIIGKLPNFKLEYESFEDDWCEDHFNSEDGHWQTGGTYYYDDFEYPVDAVDMFECLRDEILEKPGAKASNELVAKYIKLNQACEDAPTQEEWQAREDELELFLAQNLKEFVEIFNDELLDFFSERAYDWAVDHVDHYDDDDYWPEYYPDDED